MKKQLNQVRDFHEKFRAPILDAPSLSSPERTSLRYEFMKEEVEEYKEGVAATDLENVAKELADILYTTYGTILEHGLQDVIEDIFDEVHKSNMSKTYDEYKMLKGKEYQPADIKKFFA
jgi:predicted HAD superfamily Cof-like phosphohydrolase